MLNAETVEALKMEAVGRYAASVAKELNDLLSVIVGAAERIRLRTDDGVILDDLGKVLAAADLAASVSRRMNSLRGHLPRPQVFDLAEEIQRRKPALQQAVGESWKVVCLTDAQPAVVSCDPNDLEQILNELVLNARDAMPRGGTIRVRCGIEDAGEARTARGLGAPPAQWVFLDVEDSGVGMGPEVMTHVFDPFFTTKEIATGLGLPTVRRLAEGWGGAIVLDSEVGRGTRFRVRLPEAGASDAPSARTSPETKKAGDETILIVEDEDGVREAMRYALASIGYTVLPAKDGAEALDMCDRHEGKIDLVVTDIFMPKMNGRELAQHIERVRPSTRILCVSGYPETEPTQPRGSTTAVPFLQKPFHFDTLRSTVRAILDVSH
jgi:two-component system, cell cycle sensor histidine kinase and response regulator CckA